MNLRFMPKFYYQKIFKQGGNSLWGIELLTRNFPISKQTDVHIFYSAVEEIYRYDLVSLAFSQNFKIHINLFPESIDFILWERFPSNLQEVLVVEVVESEVVKRLSSVQNLRELGYIVALDDFGAGSANFQCLETFPIVKIEGDIIARVPELAKMFKEHYGVEKVIAEKTYCNGGSPYVDAFQCFEFHQPEPLDQFLLEVECTKKGDVYPEPGF